MAEVYDTTRFGELYHTSRQPTSDHLLLAATHVAKVCHDANLPYAFMGGWTVRLRGGSRQTQDVDITVLTTMDTFKEVMLQRARICFPQVHGQTSVTLFVYTGKSYDENHATVTDLAVQVDVIMSGNLNSPAQIDDSTTELLTLPNGAGARVVKVFYLLRGKFDAFMNRGDDNTNDYQDLFFLITKYPAHAAHYKSQFSAEYRSAFVTKYAELNSGNTEFIKWLENILGVEAKKESKAEDERREQSEEDTPWVWYAEHGRYGRWINKTFQWAPNS